MLPGVWLCRVAFHSELGPDMVLLILRTGLLALSLWAILGIATARSNEPGSLTPIWVWISLPLHWVTRVVFVGAGAAALCVGIWLERSVWLAARSDESLRLVVGPCLLILAYASLRLSGLFVGAAAKGLLR